MPVAKISITPEQVQADLKNVVSFLLTVEAVMPSLFEEGAIEVLQVIANSPALLTLLTTALQKV